MRSYELRCESADLPSGTDRLVAFFDPEQDCHPDARLAVLGIHRFANAVSYVMPFLDIYANTTRITWGCLLHRCLPSRVGQLSLSCYSVVLH